MSTRDTLQRHGIVKAIPYAFCRLLQRVILLDITHVMVADAEAAKAPHGQNLLDECRLLSAEEVRRFAADASNDIDPDLAQRLELGYDFCVGGITDGRLAGYCWLALDSVEAEHNRSNENPASGVAYSYPRDSAFRYKGFTHPDFRGRRVYQQLALAASREMAKRGVRYIVSTAECVNYSALKSSYRCGYDHIGYTMLVGFGNRSWVWASDLSERGIKIGRKAEVLHRASLPNAFQENEAGAASTSGEPLLSS